MRNTALLNFNMPKKLISSLIICLIFESAVPPTAHAHILYGTTQRDQFTIQALASNALWFLQFHNYIHVLGIHMRDWMGLEKSMSEVQYKAIREFQNKVPERYKELASVR